MLVFAVRAAILANGVILVKVLVTTELVLVSVDFFAIALTVVVAVIEKGALYAKQVADVVVVGSSPLRV